VVLVVEVLLEEVVDASVVLVDVDDELTLSGDELNVGAA